MKRIYKETFDCVHLNPKLDEVILNKTIYNSQKKLTKKLAIALSIFIIFIFASIGITYAEEIVEQIKKIFVTTIDLDNTTDTDDRYLTELKVENIKELNADAQFSDISFPVLDNEQKVSFNELKQNLKINVLSTNLFEKKDARIIKLEKNNNKISRGSFAFDNIYILDKGKISMSLEFITKYYEKGYFMVSLGFSRNQDNEYKAVEVNKKLNSKVYFWGSRIISNEDEKIGTLKATLIYDDIAYIFTGYNVSKNEMNNLLNDLEY
ncbi:MAG: hypothetical protein IKT40_14310 [Bacilli bacterium]|nr:hypothetical protein [Bacilli bacterium]